MATAHEVDAKTDAVKLLTYWEGFVPVAEVDTLSSSQVITVGFGTTEINGEPVPPGTTLTREEAVHLAQDRLDVDYPKIMQEFPDLASWEVSAILDFCYNLGYGAWEMSVAHNYLTNRSASQCALWMTSWCMSGDKFVEGLLNRRISEGTMFLDGIIDVTITDDYKLMAPYDMEDTEDGTEA